MSQIGRKIYYELNTGNKILEIGECQGEVRETTIDEDFQNYIDLNKRVRSSVGCIQLPFGALADKFNTCTGYYIDITKPGKPEAIVFTFTTPEASLSTVKETQKSVIEQDCQKAIISGFASSVESTEKTYGSTLEDQANITGNALAATSKIAGIPECQNDTFYYHAINEDFSEWTAQQCLQLAREFKIFKEIQLVKSKALQKYIDTLGTVEDVQKITWDTLIPTA